MIAWLGTLGLTRDSALLLWGKIVGVAGLVAAGVFNPQISGFDPALIGVSPRTVQIVSAASALVLYISGQASHSGLPNKAEKAGGTV